MTPPSISLIPSSITITTVSPTPLKPPPSVQQPPPAPLETTLFSRRNAVVWLSLVAPLTCPTSALSFGISGPKEWLKYQKKKTAKYLLAPIDASRNILRYAYLLLSTNTQSRTESEFGEKELEEVQKLLKSAARDCVPQERSSFVQFQSSTGVEVCTFQLVVKNASSLLANKDPVKLAAEAKLIDLIRSFASLNDMANECDVQAASNRQKVANALMDTVTCLDNFEQGVKECLEV